MHARQHALVYNVLARQRAHVEVAVGHAALYALAYLVERALEGGHAVVGDARYEHLPYGRLGLQGGLAKALGACGHCAQVHQREPLALNLLDHPRQYGCLSLPVLGQEHQPRAILALLGHGYALQQYELVGYLQHNASPVASLVVCALGTAVAHVLEHLQGVVNKLMAFVAVYVNHHPHAACVVLVGCIIQSFFHIWLRLVC